MRGSFAHMSDIPRLPEPTSTNPNPTEHFSGCSSDLEDGLLLAEGLYPLASRATLLAYRDEMESYLPNRIAAEELRQVNERLHSGDYYEEGAGVCLQAMTDDVRRHLRQFHPTLTADLEASEELEAYVQTQIDRTEYEMKMLTEAGMPEDAAWEIMREEYMFPAPNSL